MQHPNLKNSLSLLCFIKRTKTNAAGKVPLYMRISIAGQRAEISIRRFVNPELWDSKRQQVRGRTDETKAINDFIVATKTAMYQHYNICIKKGEEITALSFKCSYSGNDENHKTIAETFDYHNTRLQAQIGNGFSKSTYIRYRTCLNHIKEFVKWKYKTSDLVLEKINYEFITELEYFFRTIKKNSNNTTLKYINNFRKVMTLALKLGWMEKDPFVNFKCKFEIIDKPFLTEEEVLQLANTTFKTERLNLVKDIFIFSCFTGLAYTDIYHLTKKDIVTGIDGSSWININRTKTNSLSKIPLLPIAAGIIEKYSNNELCLKRNSLLPVYTNQKMNTYLKEIAAICDINKNLTCHIGRHTFATSITLTNNVPIESVQKMLGHKSIRITQHYSKLVDKKLSNDMQQLKERYTIDDSGIAVGTKV